MNDESSNSTDCKNTQLGADMVTTSATRLIQNWIDLAKLPARDDQLAQIWPPWNDLPPEMLPEEKASILTLDETSKYDRNSTRFAPFQELRGRFKYLPLDKNEYHQALNRACLWSTLTKFVQTTFGLHKTLVESQLDYSTFDNVLTGRVAIYRVVKELEITQPDLLKCLTPTLAQVQHLEQRYAAYLRAREDAISLLSPLVFLSGLQSKRELPFAEQAFGLPHPPQKFPRHIYFARLAAFGKCSSEKLAEFFAEQFLKLTKAQMDEFCDEYHRPTKGRRGKYVFLAVWLADNAPLFNTFKLTWPDILSTLRQYFNERAPDNYRENPEDADNLKVFWKEHEDRFWRGQPRRIVPPIGRPHVGQSRAVPIKLLTPLPFVPSARKG